MKNDVEIFFQKNNSVKVFEALKKIGFTKFKTMSHLKKIRVSKNVELACYAHRHLDSSLAIFVDKKFWLLNINDTELNRADINIIKDKFGSPSVLYNQFSIAGSDGIKLNLGNEAKSVLEKMVEHHKLLGANMTVPFASFVRFARKDNHYINEFVNSVYDVKEKFSQNNIKLIIQAIGGDFIKWTDVTKSATNEMTIDEQGKNYFSTAIDKIEDNHDYYIVNEEELKKTIEERVFEWHRVTSKFVLKILNLKPVRFKITDWNEEVWQVDFLRGTLQKLQTRDFDISIASQPFFQAFKLPFGIQTLGVSGRYNFFEKYKEVPVTWKKIRVLSSLYNAEIYLNLKSIFSLTVIRWIWSRRKGLTSQIIQQVKRFN